MYKQFKKWITKQPIDADDFFNGLRKLHEGRTIKHLLIILILPYLIQTQWIDILEKKEYYTKINIPIVIKGIEIENKELIGGCILFKFKF